MPETSKLVALVIAAFRSRLPVIPMAPSATVLPTRPPNWMVPVVPLVSMVKWLVWPASLSIVPPKVTSLSVVVRVMVAALKVTAPL